MDVLSSPLAGRRPAALHTVIPLSLAAFAVVLVLAATRWGVGVSPDSVTYMTNVNPGIHAPLYAWVLSLLSGWGIEVAVAARWLNVVLIATNVALVWVVLLVASGSRVAALIGTLLVLLSVQFLEVHGTAWSEPLFLLFGFSGLAVLARFLQTERVALLVMAAALIALALLTRYPGVAFVGAGCLGLLLMLSGGLGRRLGTAALFGALAAGPLALRMAATALSRGDTGTERELALLGTEVGERLWVGVLQLQRLLLPSAVPEWITGPLLLGILGLLAWLLGVHVRAVAQRAGQGGELAYLPQLLALFVLCYVAFLMLVIFVQPQIPIYPRFALMVYVAGVLMAVPLVTRWLRPRRRHAALFTVLLAAVAVIGLSHSARAGKWVVTHLQEGSGYASRAWQTSELVAHVRALDPAVTVFSNAADAVFFVAGRSAHALPRKLQPITSLPNPDYSTQLDELRARLAGEDAVLVYFDTITWRWYLPSEEELRETLPLRLVERARDGRIYRMAVD